MTASFLFTRFAALVLAAVSSFALSSCGDPHEKAAKDLTSLMNRMADTLGSVKDKASAEAAKDKLKSLNEEVKAMTSRLERLGKPSSEIEKTIESRYQDDLDTAMR